jgi:replicative DNA helicase
VNQIEISEMTNKVAEISKSNLIIDDTPALNIFEFRAKCRRLKQMYDIQMIIVDYLQLMNGKMDSKGSNRDAEIGMITRCLKSVAKELDVPVLALSQLSREVEKRPNKRPMLSDLRESGNIEQDADQVWFLYRPEYYGLTEDENGHSTIGQCQLIGAKNRHGVCETIKLDFNGAVMRMKDWKEPVTSDTKINTQQTEDFSF